jgi:hypothetical protein
VVSFGNLSPVLALEPIIVSLIVVDLPTPTTVHVFGSAIDAKPVEERKELATTRSAEAAARSLAAVEIEVFAESISSENTPAVLRRQ